MKKVNVLVTGGAGFIGSHLTDRSIKEGFKVFIIDDLSGGVKENISPLAEFFDCDLRDAEKADQIIKTIKPEIVYHLAANAAENKAQFSPIDVTSRNWNAFINTLTPFIKYGGKRFIFTSSIAVYGALQTPFRETDKPEPEDLYGITKLAAEQALKVMSQVHGFEYVITRPHNIYGPRQNMRDPYRNVVTIWMNSILQNKPYYIYGDGLQKRCFSYIDDVIEALLKCITLDVSGSVFNIGSDQDYSLNELSDAIREVTGTKIAPIFIKERPQEVKEAIADHSQARKALGFIERVTLKKGLEETWKYVKSLGIQIPVYSEIEIDSPKLPENWRVT